MCFSREGKRIQLRAGTIIQSNSLLEEFSYLHAAGACGINVWHGVGLKKVWFQNKQAFSGKWYAAKPSLRRTYNLLWAKRNLPKKAYVVGTSDAVCAYYPETFGVRPDHVLNLGQARNDVFYSDPTQDPKLPEPFGQSKIILYMPTYRAYSKNTHGSNDQSKLTFVDYEALDVFLNDTGYKLLIKDHRFNSKRGNRQAQSYSNIIDYAQLNMTIDPQLLLKYSDILITDYSSCYTDFLLLDRPVIFFCYDLEMYLKSWDMYFDYDAVTPGPKAYDTAQLIEALDTVIHGVDDYRDERERVKQIFYSPENQGPVAEKQVRYFIDHIIGT